MLYIYSKTCLSWNALGLSEISVLTGFPDGQPWKTRRKKKRKVWEGMPSIFVHCRLLFLLRVIYFLYIYLYWCFLRVVLKRIISILLTQFPGTHREYVIKGLRIHSISVLCSFRLSQWVLYKQTFGTITFFHFRRFSYWNPSKAGFTV